MSEACVEATSPHDRGEPPRSVAALHPEAAPNRRHPTPIGLLALVCEASAAALSSALLGGLAIMTYGLAAARAAGPGLEVRSWAAVALGQILLGAFVAWRARRRFGAEWRAAIGFRAVALDHRLV